MAVIIKKIDPVWFEMILSGKKKFEIRLADFDIAEGDILRLEEYTEGEDKQPTGRFIEKTITYVRKPNLKEWVEKQPELLDKSFYVIQFD